MTDLAEIDVQTPRSDDLCARYSHRMDPWWGFAIAGGLLALGGLIFPTLAFITVGPKVGIVDGSLAAKVVAPAGLAIGELAAWQLFRRWRRKRLATKRELVRSGRLVEMTVEAKVGALSRSRRYSNCVRLSGAGTTIDCGFNAWFAPKPGTTIRVLYQRGLEPVLAFDAGGAMFNGQVL